MRLAPWQVKGIGPQARETAREAARRSGVSLGDWVSSAILEQAADEDIDAVYDDETPDGDRGDDLASITGRLDDLGRQIDQLGGKRAAPSQGDHAGGPHRIADAIVKLNGRLDALLAEKRTASSALERRVDSVDQALAKLTHERGRATAAYANGDPGSISVEQASAEIAARQRALDAEFAAPAPAMLQRPVLAPFTCRADAAVDSLRKDLAEIGRALSEAMPRQAVEALEGEVRALGSRLDAAPRSGAEAPAFAGLERGLHEVRDALRGLAPAESVVGFDQAIRALSGKVDVIAAGRQDPAGLQQLEAAIGSLRTLVGQVASADALEALAQEVHGLAERIERIENRAPAADSPDMLAALDRRIGTIADAIESVRDQGARAPLSHLDQLVGSLNEKLDHLEATRSEPPSRGEPPALGGLDDRIAKLMEKLDDSVSRIATSPSEPRSRGDQLALGGLEDRIAKLAEKLDASEGRLGHLEAIERGMAELLKYLQEMRAAPPAAAAELPARRDAPSAAPDDALSQDIAALKQAQSVGERRTKDSLEDVQGTIETVVDRLATIETSIRSDPRAPARPAVPAPEPSPARPTGPPPPPPATRAASAPPPAPVAAAPRATPPPPPPPPPVPPAKAASGPRPPLDPSLPGDHPLEPGSGPPRPRPAGAAPAAAGISLAAGAAASATAAARVAASEAPLRATAAEVEPEPKLNYLQAARRAAQLAHTTQRADKAAPAPDSDKGGSKLSQRLKTLFVGLSVAVLVVVALRFAASYLQLADLLPSNGYAVAERQDQGPVQTPAGTRLPAQVEAAPQMPVIVAGTGAAPHADAPPVSIVPPVAQPAAQPIAATAATDAPAGLPPLIALNPLYAPLPLPPPLPPPSAPPSAPSPATVPASDRAAPPAVAPAPVAAAAPPASAPSAVDVTESIPPQPAQPQPAPPPPPSPAVAPIAADRLPPTIGGPGLIAAATAGDPAAAYEVATRFAEGRGVPQSFQQAAVWYERAAKGGLAPALFRLGALYEKGDGVTKDLNEARRLYLAAADKGNVNAMHNIGVLYAEGIDGKPDFTVAAQWFHKSAMFGVADSQYNLAVLYARGIGVERNWAEAYRWFALAAKSGDTDAAKKRDEIGTHLDAKSLAVARQTVDGWVADRAPEEAATVKAPPGGWDQAQQPAKHKGHAHAAHARSKSDAG